MKRLILLTLVTALTLLGSTEAVAQRQSEQYDAQDTTLATLPSDKVTEGSWLSRHLNPAYKHEVRLGIAYNPYTPHDYAPNFDWRDYPYDLPENSTLGKTRWFTVNADYGYWPLRWLYIGGVASWSGGFGRVSSAVDHSRIGCYNYHSLSLMPIVRFGWLNRSIVQLYSGVGVAAMLAIYEPTLHGRTESRWGVGFDVTFIGITVGREWFGYLDIGAGCRGTISAGIGYRFNSNSKH